MADDEGEWLGSPDAATYLGISQRTLYRLIDAGDVVAYQMGRVIRVRRSDIDAFIDRSRIQPGELRHLLPDRVMPIGEAPAAVPLAEPRSGAFTRPQDLEPCPCGSDDSFADALYGGEGMGGERTARARVIRELIDEIRALRVKVATQVPTE